MTSSSMMADKSESFARLSDVVLLTTSNNPCLFSGAIAVAAQAATAMAPYVFTKFHAVANFFESQPIAEPKYKITEETLKFMAAG